MESDSDDEILSLFLSEDEDIRQEELAIDIPPYGEDGNPSDGTFNERDDNFIDDGYDANQLFDTSNDLGYREHVAELLPFESVSSNLPEQFLEDPKDNSKRKRNERSAPYSLPSKRRNETGDMGELQTVMDLANKLGSSGEASSTANDPAPTTGNIPAPVPAPEESMEISRGYPIQNSRTEIIIKTTMDDEILFKCYERYRNQMRLQIRRRDYVRMYRGKDTILAIPKVADELLPDYTKKITDDKDVQKELRTGMYDAILKPTGENVKLFTRDKESNPDNKDPDSKDDSTTPEVLPEQS